MKRSAVYALRNTGSAQLQQGFTLLELLVSMGIFALISAMAYSGLWSVLQGKEHIEQKADQLNDLQLAITVMSRDLRQISSRSIRDLYDDQRAALSGPDFSGELMQFTRAGWSNPMQKRRSHLQRVAYRLEDEKLIRVHWNVLDQGYNNIPYQSLLIDDVLSFQIRFLDQQDKWQEYWPPLTQSEDLKTVPRALEFSLEVRGFGTITRLIPLLGAA